MHCKRAFGRKALRHVRATMGSFMSAPESRKAHRLQIDHVMFPVFSNPTFLDMVDAHWTKQEHSGAIRRESEVKHSLYSAAYLSGRDFYVEHLTTAETEPYWSNAVYVVVGSQGSGPLRSLCFPAALRRPSHGRWTRMANAKVYSSPPTALTTVRHGSFYAPPASACWSVVSNQFFIGERSCINDLTLFLLFKCGSQVPQNPKCTASIRTPLTTMYATGLPHTLRLT
jgi:hypothetical protein